MPLFNDFFSPGTVLHHYESITTNAHVAADVEHACTVPCLCAEERNAHTSLYSPQWQRMGRGAEELLNKVIIFVFFAHKKYSRSFVKLQLNHWCHMHYFNNVFTFLDLGTFKLHCCLCRVRKLSDFVKNILIFVLKMNEGLTGLERHEGKYDRIFMNPLKY